MNDEHGEERRQAEERLKRLERWRRALDANRDKLDMRERERLAKKIERERAALERRLSAIDTPASDRSDGPIIQSEGSQSPGSDSAAAVSEAPQSQGGGVRGHLRANRRRLVIAASVLVLLVAGGYIGTLLLDSQAEREVEDRVRTVIEEMQLQEQISYSSVEVNTLLGRIRFFDVSMRSPNPHSRLEANELQVNLAPDELARLAWDLEGTEITRGRLSVIGGSANDDLQAREASFDEIALGFRGSVVLETIEDPETVHFSELDVFLSGIDFSDAESGFTFRIGEAGYTASADVTLATLNRRGLGPWEYMHEFEGRLAGVGIELSDENTPELEAFQGLFGDFGWIADFDNWSIEESGIRVTFEPHQVNVESFRFISPLLAMDGAFHMDIDSSLGMERIHGELSVKELHSDIRMMSSLYLAFLGQQMPSEGPFAVSFDIDEHGDPYIEIR